MTVRDEVREVLQRYARRERPWLTATEVSRAFGYDGAQPHIESTLRALVDAGEAQRRATGRVPRAKWEYALVDV